MSSFSLTTNQILRCCHELPPHKLQSDELAFVDCLETSDPPDVMPGPHTSGHQTPVCIQLAQDCLIRFSLSFPSSVSYGLLERAGVVASSFLTFWSQDPNLKND